MAHLKFDVSKLEKLNDPARFEDLDPVAMWEALGVRTPRTIVEIGAGTGLFASRFASMAPGSTVYAVDMESTMVEWMRANRPEVAAGSVVPVLSSETVSPLPDAVADAVIMINLHHELAQPDATYAEAARLLRDGGRVLVVDWAARDTGKGPPLAVRATEAQLTATLTRAGLEDVEVHHSLPKHSLVTARRPGRADS